MDYDVIGSLTSSHSPELAIKITYFWLPWQPIGFHGNGSREVFSVPDPDLPAKFGADRSVNAGGDSTQTNSVTLLPL